MSRSHIVQGARSAEDIPGRCDVTKICDWRIWQSISQTSSDLLVLDTRGVVQKYVVDNVAVMFLGRVMGEFPNFCHCWRTM